MEQATVTDYDNALTHLIDAVGEMIEMTMAESAPVKFVDRAGKRSLGFYPPMIKLGQAMLEAERFRTLAGAPGAISGFGLNMRKGLLEKLEELSKTIVSWPELERAAAEQSDGEMTVEQARMHDEVERMFSPGSGGTGQQQADLAAYREAYRAGRLQYFSDKLQAWLPVDNLGDSPWFNLPPGSYRIAPETEPFGGTD